MRLEYRMATADGRLIWIDNIVRPVTGDDGRVRHVQGLMLDITQRKRAHRGARPSARIAEQAARVDAEASAERARFLAGASDLLVLLARSGATLDSLVRLAVPASPTGASSTWPSPSPAVACTPPAPMPEGTGVAQMLERLATSAGAARHSCRSSTQVKEGQPLLLPEIGPAWLEGLQIMQQLSPKSAMVVPHDRARPHRRHASRSSSPAPSGATARPTSRWLATSPSARRSRSTTPGSTRRPRAPTAPRTSSWPRSRTSCARR